MSEPKPGEHGCWMDEWGACRICGGEIPHGHSNNCDLYKLESQIHTLRAQLERAKVALRRSNDHLQHVWDWCCDESGEINGDAIHKTLKANRSVLADLEKGES